jgi:XTP/dITP diphosphohydrolase
VLTIMATSARVAPGLLSGQAWTALRDASRVLAGSAQHPQLPALADAGVIAEVTGDSPVPTSGPASVEALARVLADAVAASPGGSVIWLLPAGEEAPSAELLAALARAGLPAAEVRLLHGSHDLPGAHLIDVVATMDTLRASCPWDRRQTHQSLAPHLLEEPYEALEALEDGDHQALREELGDVLLQVVFHARIAADRSAADAGYTIDDVADTLVAKLIRRHPHVFADVSAESADDVTRNWDEIKKAERAAKLAAAGTSAAASPPSVLAGVVLAQPALSLAAQVLRRAARVGYPAKDPDTNGYPAPGPATGQELGQELLRLAAIASALGVDPELQLREITRQLAASVRAWELRQR